jgi:hypothetical protein
MFAADNRFYAKMECKKLVLYRTSELEFMLMLYCSTSAFSLLAHATRLINLKSMMQKTTKIMLRKMPFEKGIGFYR